MNWAASKAPTRLPLAADPARKLRIRCVTSPDPSQVALLSRLGLRLPQRLRPLRHCAKCSADFGGKPPICPRFYPFNCGSWASN